MLYQAVSGRFGKDEKRINLLVVALAQQASFAKAKLIFMK